MSIAAAAAAASSSSEPLTTKPKCQSDMIRTGVLYNPSFHEVKNRGLPHISKTLQDKRLPL